MLRDIWRPPLEALAAKFGDKVKVTPTVSPTSRDATFRFKSPLATIDLRLSATTDFEVHNLVLDYDLHVLPILMKMEPHARAEFPLGGVNSEAVRRWIDDRIVDFVKTYLSLHENENYLRDHMVADPISATRFPKYAAAEILEWNGNKYYFVGKETRAEFEKKNKIPSK
jgi:YHS domain-containing protein